MRATLASLHQKHPQASSAELRGLLFLWLYADDFSAHEQTKIYEFLVAEE